MDKEAFLGGLLAKAAPHAQKLWGGAKAAGSGFMAGAKGGATAGAGMANRAGGAANTAGNWIKANPMKSTGGAAAGAYGMSGSRVNNHYYGANPMQKMSEEISLDLLVSPKAFSVLSGPNLHKVAARMASSDLNVDISELNFPTAMYALGSKYYTKKAEERNIRNAIKAYEALKENV